MVDEKMYSLLEKLYNEVQGMQTEIGDIKKTIATKDDLKDFATKDDLKNVATKDDINILAEELHAEIQMVYDELVELRNDLNTMEILTTKNAYDIAKLKCVR